MNNPTPHELPDNMPPLIPQGLTFADPRSEDLEIWSKVLHMLPSWFWETDGNYRITYVSENVEPVASIRPEDIMGLCILNPTYGKTETEAGLGAYQEALRNKEVIKTLTYERLMLSGEKAVLMDSALPKFTASGEFQGYRGVTFHLSAALNTSGENYGIVADLRSRADALEAALAQRNQELEYGNKLMTEVFDAMGEGLLVTSGTDLNDKDNRVVLVNPAYRILFGFDEGEVYPGKPIKGIADILVNRGDLPRHNPNDVDHKLNDGGAVKLNLRSQGRSIYSRATERPGGGFVLVHTDITDIENRTRMLERARRAADNANAAKSNFLAAMSHEIRTPMNGIVGMTDLLTGTGLNPEQSECVDTIRSSALALTALISDILDFSKIEAGHLELENAPFSIHALGRDVAALMRPMAEANGLCFKLDQPQDMPEWYSGDGPRLRQILVNLLGNAVKFTLEGGVTLRLRKEEEEVQIDIVDTGIGIPEDKIGRIFAPFEQAQGGLQRQFEGTGLGLAITHRLIGQMGGKIGVSSRVGKGTSFTVTLPLPVVAAPKGAGKGGTGDAGDLSERHVLVAEDNRTNQLVVRKMLGRIGVQVTIAEDGQAAIEACANQRFDLILMDLSMPRVSGLEATRVIRQVERKTGADPMPIVALTGNAFDKDKQDALSAGMDGFLSKPVRLQILQECLARHLGDGTQEEVALKSGKRV